MASEALGSFTGGTAEGAVKFLLELIRQEVTLLGGLGRQVDEIQCELEFVQSFLKDAASKDLTERTIAWKVQVRDAAYEAEDLIDEFMHHLVKVHRRGVQGSIRRTIYFVKTIYVRHQIATSLGKTVIKFQRISDAARRYGLQTIEPREIAPNNAAERRRLHSERAAFPSNDDDNLVDIVANRDKLVKWVREKEPQRTVIGVTGMGGLGKTTLVGKSYHHVKNNFSCCAWITVSQSYRIRDAIQSLIKQFTPVVMNIDKQILENKDNQELVSWLYNHLEQQKYLVVLDDVWDVNFWRDIKVALPNNMLGSRVMLTTRLEEVASSVTGVKHVFRLRCLDDKNAWLLFCKVAFRDIMSRTCPAALESSARAIVKKCEGLPLAIVAMAGLLASKDKTPPEWKKIEDNLGWHLSNDQMLDPIKSVLSLSFDDLPYHLKHCFLHFCIFPEDYSIKKSRLARLWMAEGFVEEGGGGALEDRAESYLAELVSRNVIQSLDRKTYRMHDVVHDLALQISQKENFLMAYDRPQVGAHSRARRLSIYTDSGNISPHTKISHLRSFFIFDKNPLHCAWLIRAFSNFRLLRVLDLEGCPISNVPYGLWKLFNLRYLSLRNTQVKDVPKGIEKLQNLQTVDFRGTWMKEVPIEVTKLEKLRHVTVWNRHHVALGAPRGICKLTSLRTLSNIKADDMIVKELGDLIQLRRLGIGNVHPADGNSLCSSLSKMNHLRSLSVSAANGDERLFLESMSSPPPYLQKLKLEGRLLKLPEWFGSLLSLSSLHLAFSHLSGSPLPSIQDLPHLTKLTLDYAYDGQTLTFHQGSFKTLEQLYFIRLTNLAEIVIQEGALPNIRDIVLYGCPNMKSLPLGLEYLKGVKLSARGMPEKFTKSHEQFIADQDRILAAGRDCEP